MHQSHQFVIALDYDALVDHRHGVELVLNLFRIDVLTIRSQQHVLASSSYEEMSVGVHRCQVACMEPSVFIYYGICCLLVLVIALHHIDAAANQFTGYVLRVIAQNLYLHVLHGNTTASCHIVVLMGKGDKWSSLSGTISHCDRETYADEEVLYLLVERSTTHNNLARTFAKLSQYKLANLLLDALIDDRHVHQQSCTVGLDMWEYFLSYNLVYYKRHRIEDVWLDF